MPTDDYQRAINALNVCCARERALVDLYRREVIRCIAEGDEEGKCVAFRKYSFHALRVRAFMGEAIGEDSCPPPTPTALGRYEEESEP